MRIDFDDATVGVQHDAKMSGTLEEPAVQVGTMNVPVRCH